MKINLLTIHFNFSQKESVERLDKISAYLQVAVKARIVKNGKTVSTFLVAHWRIVFQMENKSSSDV